ncbi:MAG: hypothetical protein LUD51_02000 [Clostridia bacterium]|nr:hypothetical protein [Clostridia bacterium]
MERLVKSFKPNEPIFTSELESVYTEFSHASLFRQIDDTVKIGLLKKYVRGVYYLPAASGRCGITTEDVIRKKYLGWDGRIYGTYAGPQITNYFRLTRNSRAMREIVSNNETSRGRKVSINGTACLVKKSKCEITADNVAAYMLVQLFDELSDDASIPVATKGSIMKFIRQNNVSKEQVMEISEHFTARPVKNLQTAGILQQIA